MEFRASFSRAPCSKPPPQRKLFHHPVVSRISPFHKILLYRFICNTIYHFMNLRMSVLQAHCDCQGPDTNQTAHTHWDNSQETCYAALGRVQKYRRWSMNLGAVTTLDTKGGRGYQKERELWSVCLLERSQDFV